MISAAIVALPFAAALLNAINRSSHIARLVSTVLVLEVILAAFSLTQGVNRSSAPGLSLLGEAIAFRPASAMALATATLVVLAALAVSREQTVSSAFAPPVLLGLGGLALAVGLSSNAVAVGLALGFVVAVLVVATAVDPITTANLRVGQRYLTWTALAVSALVLSSILDRLYARQPGPGLLGAVAGLFVVGVGILVAAFPLALWLPGLAEDAPLGAGVASALLTSGAVAVIAGSVGSNPWLLGGTSAQNALAAFGGFGGLLSVILAVGEKRPNRVFAFLVSANASFAVTTLAISAPGDAAGAVWILGAQVLAAGLGFTSLAAADGKLATLFWRRPAAAIGLWVAALTLVGLPLTAGFIGRLVAAPAIADQHLVLILLSAFTSAIGGLAATRHFGPVFERDDVTRELVRPFDFAAIVLSAVLVLAGVIPGPLLALLR